MRQLVGFLSLLGACAPAPEAARAPRDGAWSSRVASVDTTAPTGTVSIAGGAAAVGGTRVTLALSADDVRDVLEGRAPEKPAASVSTPEVKPAATTTPPASTAKSAADAGAPAAAAPATEAKTGTEAQPKRRKSRKRGD